MVIKFMISLNKICSYCKTNKKIEEFGKHKSATDGLQCWCKECAHIKKKAYDNKRKKQISDYAAIYYQAHKEVYKNSYIQNRERKLQINKAWKDSNKKHRAETNKIWAKANKGLVTFHARKRQLDIIKATPKWLSDENLLDIINFYKNRPENYHVDHIIPINGKEVRGLHVPWNLQYLPAVENMRKGNRVGGLLG